MENQGLLFAAFAVVWIGFYVYLLSLFRRQSRLKRDIDSLKKTLSEKGAGQQER